MPLNLQAEYLPAAGAARQSLVLLHGWGSNAEIWRPLLVALRPWADVTLLQLPGLNPALDAAEVDLEDLAAAVLDAAPERAVYVGWSLGGQLAIALAHLAPQRVEAVITLCSNPRFVATGDWPGMDAEMLDQFRAAARLDVASSLRRFDSLQVSDALQPRLLLRRLAALRAGASCSDINRGLDWLSQLDLRDRCRSQTQPQMHLLGERDGLVPAVLADHLRGLLANRPDAVITVLHECSHMAPLEDGPVIAQHIETFLMQQALLRSVTEPDLALDKRDVALSFSRAAGDYDSVASLQRDVGQALLGTLDHLRAPATDILDLGSGTGYFMPALRERFPHAVYTGLDLAEGMVRFSRDTHQGSARWLVGDAEALPLAAGSVDLIFSSLAVQWCQRPAALFAELARVLRPGGICLFTTLGPATLKELRDAWAAVDQHQHVNRFLPLAELHQAADTTPGVSLSLQVKPYLMQYRRVSELLNELKTLGAHNVNRSRPAGLTGRRALLGMMQAYESWREQDLLPATYEVFFGVLERS